MIPNIIYEDNHIIVTIKPRNIAVQEDESKDKDMLTILKEMIKERDNKPGNVFLGLVHRLDRPTGGVMVFAKTSKAAERLSKQLREKTMTKKYLCVVNGKPVQPQDKLITYLKKNGNTNTVSIAPQFEEGAKYAELDYNLISTKNNFSLLDISLHTGRSHQIRVQMATQNKTPIFSDFKYGDKKHGSNLGLWAYNLKFVHPTTQKIMNFKVFPPIDEIPFSAFKIEIEKMN